MSCALEPESGTIDKTNLPDGWMKESTDVGLKFYKISGSPPNSIVSHSIVVRPDKIWSAYVHGIDIHDDIIQADTLASTCIEPVPSIAHLIESVENYVICPGNPDDHFIEILASCNGKIMSKDGKSVSGTLDYDSFIYGGKYFSKTVRVSNCTKIIKASGRKCNNCESYRSVLRKLYSRLLKLKNSHQGQHLPVACSHTNNRYMETPEKQQKMSRLTKENKALKRQVDTIKKRIENLTISNGTVINESFHTDLVEIMNQCNNEVISSYPPNSFRCLFWEQHYENVKKKDSRQLRWHPAMIKWCLSLKMTSSSCYNALRASN